MPETVGIVGCGNMGGAILGGFAARLDGMGGDWRLVACNRAPARLEPFTAMGVAALPDAAAVAKAADIIIMAVKPYQACEVLAQCRPRLTRDKTVISIAAGLSLASLRKAAGPDCGLCRCMPTTTAMAGHGIFAFCFDDGMAREREDGIIDLFQCLGLCLRLPEERFTDFSAFMGAGPAYVFACMQGLAQAGLTLGFSQAQSREMLIELFVGAGELARMQPKNFAQLRDDVCSPAGLTIAGVNTLDRAGLSGLLVDAVEAAAKRGREMEA